MKAPCLTTGSLLIVMSSYRPASDESGYAQGDDLEHHANFIDNGNAYHELRDNMLQLILELILTADKMDEIRPTIVQ